MKYIKRIVLTCAALYVIGMTVAVMFFGGISVDHLNLVDAYGHSRQLVEQGRYAEAEEYLELYLDVPLVQNKDKMARLLQDVREKRASTLYTAKQVFKGFFLGESDEEAGNVAALISEFLVVGDIRDLSRETAKFYHDEPVDKLTVALSTAGVGLAVAGIGPQAPAVASIKASTSLFKMANKLHLVSKNLSKFLVEAFEVAKKSKSVAHLTGMMTALYDAAKAGGTRAAMMIIKHSDNAEDITRLARFVQRYGRRSQAYLRYGGRHIADVLDRFGKKAADTALAFGEGGVTLMHFVTPSRFGVALRTVRALNSGSLGRTTWKLLSSMDSLTRLAILLAALGLLVVENLSFFKWIYRKIRPARAATPA